MILKQIYIVFSSVINYHITFHIKLHYSFPNHLSYSVSKVSFVWVTILIVYSYGFLFQNKAFELVQTMPR